MFYTYLSLQWHKLPTEIWREFFMLDRYPSLSTGTLPSDLCIELVRPIYDRRKSMEQASLESLITKTQEESDYNFACWQALGDEYEFEFRAKEEELLELRERLTSLRSDDILTNPDSAYEFLVSWHYDAGLDEKEVLDQLVEWFDTIKEVSYDLADSYTKLIQKFFQTNNLRYNAKRNNDVLEIAFNPAFVASERFLAVKELYCDDAHLKNLYADFEAGFGDLYRNKTATQVKSAIGTSSNLVEALANKVVGTTGKTLSAILKAFLPEDSFPHAEAQSTLSKMYGFFSDYPGIRHGGSASSATRVLAQRDAFLFGSLSILFADYLSRRECPICESDMSIQSGSKGSQWVCSRAPSCAGVAGLTRPPATPSLFSRSKR